MPKRTSSRSRARQADKQKQSMETARIKAQVSFPKNGGKAVLPQVLEEPAAVKEIRELAVQNKKTSVEVGPFCKEHPPQSVVALDSMALCKACFQVWDPRPKEPPAKKNLFSRLLER